MKQAWQVLQEGMVCYRRSLRPDSPNLTCLMQSWATTYHMCGKAYGVLSQTLNEAVYGILGDEVDDQVILDHWISNIPPENLRQLNIIDHEMWVYELIDPPLGDWNAILVHSLLPPLVACKILKIKILPTLQSYKFIWAYEKIGIYSVKSTYRRVFEEKLSHLGETSTLTEIKLFWKNLWKLQVPNKIKMTI